MPELEGIGLPEAELNDKGCRLLRRSNKAQAQSLPRRQQQRRRRRQQQRQLPAVSNQEAMVAQTLSRTKKRSRQIEKANKLVQIQAQLKDLEKQ
jgi:hypothetical protein